MIAVRGVLTEAVILHRRLWPWVALALVGWLMFLRVQEPEGLRRSGLPFFWAGAEAGVLFLTSLLPIAWTAARRPEAAQWNLRLSCSPIREVTAAWLGIAGLGVALAVLACLTSITLNSIYGLDWGGRACLTLLLEVLHLALPLAAVAPAIAYLGLPIQLSLCVWLGILAASLVWGVPIPTSSLLTLRHADLSMASYGIAATGAAALATCGGLLLSVVVIRCRLASIQHAHRNPRRHP